jgi:hypothetical protein
MSSNKNAWKKTVFFFPLTAILFFIVMKLRFNAIYSEMIQEDKFLEYSECLIFFAAAWIALLIGMRFRTQRTRNLRALYYALFIALLFVSLEEISWGQRIIGFRGLSAIVAHNTQNEFTIHNLNFVQPFLHAAYILVGIWGAFGDLLISGKRRQNLQNILGFIVPDRLLIFYFLPTFVAYLFLGYVRKIMTHWFKWQSFEIGNFFVWRDQEPAEFMLSLGILLFILMAGAKQKRQHES